MDTHTLLSGETVALADLSEREREFLGDLDRMRKTAISYFEVYRTAIGPGSPALQGRTRVNQRTLDSNLYRVARDIATRVGIKQGLILAPEYEVDRAKAAQYGSMISVTQTAELVGVTRASIYKAIKSGNLRVQKLGNVTVVDKESAMEFRYRRAQRSKKR